MLRKYFQIIAVNLQTTMEYKFNFLTTIICSFIPFGVNSLIWYSISNYSADSYSYSLNEMITYYFFIMIVSNIVQTNVVYRVSDDIRMGELNQYLLRPTSYMGLVFWGDVSSRFVFILFGILPIGGLYFALRGILVFDFNWVLMVYFIVSLVISYSICFLLYYLLGLLSFYFSQVNQIVLGFNILMSILSGKVFPLKILPEALLRTLSYTPFQYLGYVPVTVIQNKYSAFELNIVLVLGLFWVVLLFAACKLIWVQGLKKYSAFGG